MFLSGDMMNIKLLLIEDDEDDYVLTRDLLDEIAKDQYTLEWASSPEEARAALARNEHDLCLMDYWLGAESGLTLLQEAPELGFAAPIIMLTGQDDKEVDNKALRAGAVDYLVKSQLNSARLARAVRYAVARREVETERLERLRVEAESRSKSEFLAHLSHELRTPLTAILGYTDILLHRSSSERDEADLQTIKRNGQHLLSLLNDVLDLSKIAAGKLEINLRRVDLNAFLADMRSLMEVAAKEKNLELRFSAREDLPAFIRTDPIRLRQILINLIGNAIKFTERGSVTIEISIPHRATSQICFAIRDTGVGISSRDLEKLFQPFSQGEGNRAVAQQGSGLGLVISKQLAARLGGDIRVDSELAKGSTFTLLVEAGAINEVDWGPLAMSSKPEPALSTSNVQLSGRILVVDDLPDIRFLVGEIISSAGAQVCYAADGDEAVQVFEQSRRDNETLELIIMDMQMPGMDGLSASRELRRRGCDCPILALTAATMQGEKERCLTAGCDDYLSKPVEESALLNCMQTLLARNAAAKPSEFSGEADGEKLILLVEDNEDARQATQQILGLLGWSVLGAGSGEQARAIVRKNKRPALAFVDINLPDADGYELIEELRQSGLSNTRFITLSGYAGDAARSRTAGVERHLTKPLGITELREVLQPYG